MYCPDIDAAISEAFRKVLGFDPKVDDAGSSLWSPRWEPQPNKKRKNINKKELVQKFKSGKTVSEICDEMSISSATVYYHLKKAGLK